jgi:hypothetical protein
MNITQTKLAQYFKAGDRMKTGGGTAVFEIVAIESDCVRIKPDNAKNPARLDLRKLNAVLKHASQIEKEITEGSGIEKTIGKALEAEILGESQTETYLWGFVRELLKRRANSPATNKPQPTFDINDQAAIEGYEFDRNLIERGRNRFIAEQRKKKDDYTCAVCKFRLRINGHYVIECHHLQPLAMSGEREVSLKDLVCLCPTCHRIAHTREVPFSVDEIKALRLSL